MQSRQPIISTQIDLSPVFQENPGDLQMIVSNGNDQSSVIGVQTTTVDIDGERTDHEFN